MHAVLVMHVSNGASWTKVRTNGLLVLCAYQDFKCPRTLTLMSKSTVTTVPMTITTDEDLQIETSCIE